MLITKSKNYKLGRLIEYLLYIFVFLIPWQTRYIYKYLSLGGEVFEYGKLAIYVSEAVLLLLIFLALFFLRTDKFKKIYLLPIVLLIISLLGYFNVLNYEMYFYGLGKLVELVLLFLIISRLNFNYFKLLYLL